MPKDKMNKPQKFYRKDFSRLGEVEMYDWIQGLGIIETYAQQDFIRKLAAWGFHFPDEKTKISDKRPKPVRCEKAEIVTLLNVSYQEKDDAINHPSHYCLGGIEVIDAIEAWGLGYHLGNVVKYIARADHKGEALIDLQKGAWYLDREIKRREGGEGK